MGFLSAILRGIFVCLYLFVYTHVSCSYVYYWYGSYVIKCNEHFYNSHAICFISYDSKVDLICLLKIVMKKKKQMSGVLIVALIPLVVCTAQLSMNTYTSKFNQDRWLHAEDKRGTYGR